MGFWNVLSSVGKVVGPLITSISNDDYVGFPSFNDNENIYFKKNDKGDIYLYNDTTSDKAIVEFSAKNAMPGLSYVIEPNSKIKLSDDLVERTKADCDDIRIMSSPIPNTKGNKADDKGTVIGANAEIVLKRGTVNIGSFLQMTYDGDKITFSGSRNAELKKMQFFDIRGAGDTINRQVAFDLNKMKAVDGVIEYKKSNFVGLKDGESATVDITAKVLILDSDNFSKLCVPITKEDRESFKRGNRLNV